MCFHSDHKSSDEDDDLDSVGDLKDKDEGTPAKKKRRRSVSSSDFDLGILQVFKQRTAVITQIKESELAFREREMVLQEQQAEVEMDERRLHLQLLRGKP